MEDKVYKYFKCRICKHVRRLSFNQCSLLEPKCIYGTWLSIYRHLMRFIIIGALVPLGFLTKNYFEFMYRYLIGVPGVVSDLSKVTCWLYMAISIIIIILIVSIMIAMFSELVNEGGSIWGKQ